MEFALDLIDISDAGQSIRSGFDITQVPAELGVFHKLTEGRTELDQSVGRRWEYMRATFPTRGLYHWLTPTWRSPVDQQAEWFLSHLRQWLPLLPGEAIQLDVEQWDGPGTPPADVHRWCELVELEVGPRVLVYVGRNFPGWAEMVDGRPWWLPDYRQGVASPPGVTVRQWAGGDLGALVCGRRVDSNQVEDVAAWRRVTALSAIPRPPEVPTMPAHAAFALRSSGAVVQLVYRFDGQPRWRPAEAAGEGGVVYAVHPGGAGLNPVGEDELAAMGEYDAAEDVAWLAQHVATGSGPSAADIVHALGAALVR
jgi:hypothetical protein